MSKKEIKLLLVDDHSIVREGIRRLLDKMSGMRIVGEAENGQQAVALARKTNPDIVLMDIAMPEMNGLEAASYIVRDSDKTNVIILSMHTTKQFVMQALKSGATGYLLKNVRAPELEEAIRTVAKGGVYLTQSLAGTFAEYIRNPEQVKRLDMITPRQKEVLQLVAEGYSLTNIAAKLNISKKTVETHRARLMESLEIFDTAGLVKFAIREGLITADD